MFKIIRRFIAPGIILTLSLVMGFGPWGGLMLVMASEMGHQEELQVSIGKVESYGEMIIEERRVKGSQAYKTGETVRSLDHKVRMDLFQIGKMVLAPGTELKIESVTGDNNETTVQVWLIGGSVDIRLNESVRAGVRIGNQNYIAGRGAIFSLSDEDRNRLVTVKKGQVQQFGGWGIIPAPLGWLVADATEPVVVGEETRAPEVPLYRIVPLNAARRGSFQPHTINNLQFQVLDRANKPVKRRVVAFAIDNSADLATGSLGGGSVSTRRLSVVTDTEGVAIVPFRAGSRPGTIQLTAAVDGTVIEQDQSVKVGESRFWTKRTALPVFGVVAAVITAAVLVVANRVDQLPIKGTGPIVIVP